MTGLSIFGQLAPFLLIALGLGYLACSAASNAKENITKIVGYVISAVIILISAGLLINAMIMSAKVSAQLKARAKMPAAAANVAPAPVVQQPVTPTAK